MLNCTPKLGPKPESGGLTSETTIGDPTRTVVNWCVCVFCLLRVIRLCLFTSLNGFQCVGHLPFGPPKLVKENRGIGKWTGRRLGGGVGWTDWGGGPSGRENGLLREVETCRSRHPRRGRRRDADPGTDRDPVGGPTPVQPVVSHEEGEVQHGPEGPSATRGPRGSRRATSTPTVLAIQ